jgi:ATP-dependent Clp protease ATP-binding subunit ClpA
MMKYDTSRLTPRMVRCLERADDIADSMGHDYTGCEHVVLSIFADEEAVPTHIADQAGVLGYLVMGLHNFFQTGRVDPPAVKLVPETSD